MPIDPAGLFGPFHSLHLLLSCWAGIALCRVSIFAHYAAWREPRHFFLLAVLRLMRLCTIAANLRCVALSGDVAVVVAAEALHHSARAVVEFALVYLAFPCHSSVDDSIG